MGRVILILLLIGGNTKFLIGQQAYFTSSNQNFHLLDRIEMLEGKLLNSIFTSVKPYQINPVFTISKNFKAQSNQDKFNKYFLQKQCFEMLSDTSFKNEKARLKHFYTYQSFLYGKKNTDFQFFINPIAYFSGGLNSADKQNLFQNTRGVVVRGSLSNKLGFYSELTENQARFASHVRDREQETGVLPNQGFYKSFSTNAYDFFGYRGYINFKALPQIDVQFGHDQNFIGNGKRSLILGDFAPPNLFVKLNTTIRNVNYLNIFSEHTNLGGLTGNGSNQSKKYAAFHHLSMNFGKKVNIGLFEHIVFSRQDSLQNPGFELNYINPIIFYRGVEQNLNSSDNAFLGMEYKYLPRKNMTFYGQFVLDEFKIKEIIANRGWWANKWALQIGFKAINIFHANNLDFLVEFNQARPFTYTHFKESQNLIHYRQPLAHPLGTNFRETLLELKYQARPKWTFTCLAAFMKNGIDSNVYAKNIGGDILKSYNDRAFEYGNKTLQGNLRNVVFLDFWVQYQLNTFAFIDLTYTHRRSRIELPTLQKQNNHILSISLRYFINRNVPLY